MRCLVCNAEMVLMEAVLTDPTILPGFEHRTFACFACRDIERRLVFTGANAPADAHRQDQTGGGTAPGSAWGRAVEKVLTKQMALNGRTAAKRRPDSPSTVEKLGRGHSGGEERPSPAKSIDLVSELNRIWDDPRPAADKPLEPPATPKVD
jgi:hypothetical protein